MPSSVVKTKTIMTISAYCDINLDPISADIKNALAYAKQRGYSVLLAADTNAHSVLWGKETNRRGQEVEDFISTENLTIHNIGREYTFECATGKSIIDVTMSHNLKLKLNNWRVCKKFNGSDHNTIIFFFLTGAPP